MTHFTFHADEHGCIRVQLGAEPDPSDPTIFTSHTGNAGWARKLVEQANDQPPFAHTTSMTMGGSGAELAMLRRIKSAADALHEQWDACPEGGDVVDHVEDQREELFDLLDEATRRATWP